MEAARSSASGTHWEASAKDRQVLGRDRASRAPGTYDGNTGMAGLARPARGRHQRAITETTRKCEQLQ
eukprot:3942519-Pyramimonas_sp.AAC.1